MTETINEVNEPHLIHEMYGEFITRVEKCVEVGDNYVEMNT